MTKELLIIICIATLALFWLACFIIKCRNVKPTDQPDDFEYKSMSSTYYFKHPCGQVVEQDGKRKHFTYFEAQDFALSHPYYYVKSYTDEHWQFAETYFKQSKVN